MKAIADEQCCGKQDEMKKLIDSLIAEISTLNYKVKEIEKRLNVRQERETTC